VTDGPFPDWSTNALPGWYTAGVDEGRYFLNPAGSTAADQTAARADYAGILKTSIEMFDTAFEKFASQAKTLLFALVALLSVAAAILTLALKESPRFQTELLAAAGVVLLIAWALAENTKGVLSACYDRYVAGVLWAAQLHEAVGLTRYSWFGMTRESAKRANDQNAFFSRWRDDGSTVYGRYARVLDWLKWPCLVLGIGLILVAVLSWREPLHGWLQQA